MLRFRVWVVVGFRSVSVSGLWLGFRTLVRPLRFKPTPSLPAARKRFKQSGILPEACAAGRRSVGLSVCLLV